jgi:hypothetical protein
MYMRQAKQFLRTAIEGFDERKYGFASVVDLLRAAARENVVRLERDRQGAVRVFPGINLESKVALPPVLESMPMSEDAEPETEAVADAVMSETVEESMPVFVAEPVEEASIVEAAVAAVNVGEDIDEDDDGPHDDDVDGNRIDAPPPSQRSRKRTAAGPRAAKTTRSRARTPKAHGRTRRKE